MNRRLVFVRHVSSPHPSGVSDFDRPIDSEGREDAARLAVYLRDIDWLPHRVLCSDAKRARQTWEAMATELDGEDFEVDYTRELYGARIDGICEQIWALDIASEAAALVGHNPGFSDIVSWLTGIETSMPKGSAALLTTPDGTWSEVTQQNECDLEELVRPAVLRIDDE